MRYIFQVTATIEHPDFYFSKKDIELLLDSENPLFGFQVLVYRLLEIANNTDKDFLGEKYYISKILDVLSDSYIKSKSENFKENLNIEASNTEENTVTLNCSIPALNDLEFIVTVTQTNLLPALIG